MQRERSKQNTLVDRAIQGQISNAKSFPAVPVYQNSIADSATVQRIIAYDDERFGADDDEKLKVKLGDDDYSQLRSDFSDTAPYNIKKALESSDIFDVVKDEEAGAFTITKRAAAKEESKDRLQEAGSMPMLALKPSSGKDSIIIKGLIMCVEIIVEACRDGSVEAASGSHFVTPECVESGAINEKGLKQLADHVNLVRSHGTSFGVHLFRAGEEEAKTTDQKQAKEAMDLIESSLGGNGVAIASKKAGVGSSRTYNLKADGTAVFS